MWSAPCSFCLLSCLPMLSTLNPLNDKPIQTLSSASCFWSWHFITTTEKEAIRSYIWGFQNLIWVLSTCVIKMDHGRLRLEEAVLMLGWDFSADQFYAPARIYSPMFLEANWINSEIHYVGLGGIAWSVIGAPPEGSSCVFTALQKTLTPSNSNNVSLSTSLYQCYTKSV